MPCVVLICIFIVLQSELIPFTESDGLVNKYKNAIANVALLKSLGATLYYGVDATNMADLPDLRWKKFDRIIYNFPHAGFHGHESNPHLIK